MDLANILTAVGVLVGALLVIAGVVVKLTPGKKDDELFAKVKEVLDPLVKDAKPEDVKPSPEKPSEE